MDDARLMCSRLLREGAVERRELRGLEFPEIRGDVERRLAEVGIVLATSAYSEHVGLRLHPDVTGDQAFDSASNLGLHADACALLVILWARLVLQKRTVIDTRATAGQGEIFASDQATAAKAEHPHVKLEALMREFGPVLGSRDHIKRLVSQLRRLRFVSGRGEIIEAGPLLELGIDGERMVAFLRRGVLKQLMENGEGSESEPQVETADRQLLAVLEELGGTASTRQLAERTGERHERVREILRALEENGKVERTGARAQTRYHLRRG